MSAPFSPSSSSPPSFAAPPAEAAALATIPPSRVGTPTGTALLLSILTFVGIVLFVDVQIVAAAAAAVWATAGLLHLPLVATLVLAAVIGVPVVWACWIVARRAWWAEFQGGEETVPDAD